MLNLETSPACQAAGDIALGGLAPWPDVFYRGFWIALGATVAVIVLGVILRRPSHDVAWIAVPFAAAMLACQGVLVGMNIALTYHLDTLGC